MFRPQRFLRGQEGYTLVEVVITAALAALVMSGLTSVVLTTWRGSTVASNRVEASAQIRAFESFAYDDFAGSATPNAPSCTQPTPCTTTPLVLNGVQVSSSSLTPSAYQVTYALDADVLKRQLGSNGPVFDAATGVSAFSWYVDSSGQSPTVVVSLTVTVGAYSDSQTFRFYTRLNP